MDLIKSYLDYEEEEQGKYLDAFINEDLSVQESALDSQSSSALIAIANSLNSKKVQYELKDLGCLANSAKYITLSRLKAKVSDKKIISYTEEEQDVFFSLLGLIRFDEVEDIIDKQPPRDLDQILEFFKSKNEKKNAVVDKIIILLESKQAKAANERELLEKVSQTSIPDFSAEFENKYKEEINTEEKITELTSLLEEVEEIIKTVASFNMRNEVVSEIYDLLLSADNFEDLKDKAAEIMYIRGIGSNLMMEEFTAEHNIKFLAQLESAASLDDVEDLCHDLGYQAEELSHNTIQDKLNKVNDASQRRQNESSILFDDEDMRILVSAENTVCDDDSLYDYEVSIRLIEIKHMLSCSIEEKFIEVFKSLTELTSKDKIDILKKMHGVYKSLVAFDEQIEGKEFPDSLAEDLCDSLADSLVSHKFSTLVEYAKNNDYLNVLLDNELYIKDKSKLGLNTIMKVFGKGNEQEEIGKDEALIMKDILLFKEHEDLSRSLVEEKANELLHVYDYIRKYILTQDS